MSFDVETRIRNVTAVLGPTNTGKTHLAIERMLGHETGMIGLPLRLLAREVYDRIAARIGADKVALVTGEEKIRPPNARFWVSTVEAMPREIDVDFLAIDEIQLAADLERGHVFTDRLLHARGKLETLLLGASTMRDTISDLVPGANFITRPRLSKLSYTGQKKITRLPARTAIVAFSASEVYAIAELIRRQQGGAAVVMGAMSPRTRNAQVALYQSGDVDYLVATDAIGMGLNLDVHHVSFAAIRKFDGHNHRMLTPAELGQIAGRAGRHMNDGTFGVTGDVEPFEQDVIERLETHTFDPVKVLQWRARNLDFSSLYALRESLKQLPREQRLMRARMADDVEALESLSSVGEIADRANSPATVSLLWDTCQIPDYRKISNQNHAELIANVFGFLTEASRQIPEDWLAKQVEFSDRTDGDIDTLANRISHIRTWTFVSNRATWLKDPAHWQGRTREIEDALSDALHEQLTQRFVDRRTSALMKGLRAKEDMAADIGDDGAIHVESHYVGRIKGFRFIPDASQAEGIHGKAARHAAAQVLAKELVMRVRRVVSAKNDAFKLTRNGRIIWRDQEIAKLEPSEDGLKPQIAVIADEHLPAADKDKIQQRLTTWLAEAVADKLAPLAEIAKAEDIAGLARGIAFRLLENFGSLKREAIADEIKTLDQAARSQLRKYGVRFGAFNIYFPQILKPAAAELALALWSLKHAAAHGLDIEALPDPPRAGLTSVPANPQIPEAFYRICGYHVCGPRALRMDMLERLADLIRPLIAWRKPADMATATPPRGSTGDGAFIVIPEMLSILGCSTEEFALVLKTLGFRMDRRPKRVAPVALAAPVVEAGDTSTATMAVSLTASEASDQPSVTSAEVVAAPEPTPEATAPLESTAESALAAAVEPAPSAGATVASTDPAATSADIVASAPADEGKPIVQVEDVEFEEIWRPRRHRHDNERQGQRRGERGPGDRIQGNRTQSDRPQGERTPGERGARGRNRGNRGGARRDQQPADGTPPPATPVEGGTADIAVAADQKPSEGRDDRRPNDRPRHERGPRRDGQPGGGPHHGKGPAGSGQGRTFDRKPGESRQTAGKPGERPDRDGANRDRTDRGYQGRGYQGHNRNDNRDQNRNQPKPQRQTADPDSPFAKLSALKLELEKRAQETSSS